MIDYMQGLSVSHLRFRVRAREGIVLEGQPGSALRGMLYGALSDNFCSEPGGPHTQGHQDRCPVCWLLAFNDPNSPRGRNQPKPVTFHPPEARNYRRDETFVFGINLIGAAQNLMPYVARAVERGGQRGLGRGRGRFILESISEYSPLLDANRDLMDGRTVRKPTLQVTAARVNEAAAAVESAVTLEMHTPTRLIANSVLVKKPDPQVFVQRLIERCQSLATYFAETEQTIERDDWRTLSDRLTEQAATWRIAYDDTEWFEAFSGSRRHGRSTPISGLIGTVRWEGDVKEAYRWLLWGQSLHVGKDAVKGNGWYRVVGK